MPAINYPSFFDKNLLNIQTEDLSSQCNGVATTFTVSTPFDQGKIFVYYNGIRQQIGNGITVSSTQTFTTSFTPAADDTLYVDFQPLS